MAARTLAKALNDGLRAAMERDPKVLVMGEDVGKLGGVFRVTDGLQKDFGEDRVIDTPLSESGILGTAVGLALRGSARRAGCRCRWWCASRSAAASAPWSTTASRRRRCSPTSPG